jgi:predicted secreted Zn-dependent protease
MKLPLLILLLAASDAFCAQDVPMDTQISYRVYPVFAHRTDALGAELKAATRAQGIAQHAAGSTTASLDVERFLQQQAHGCVVESLRVRLRVEVLLPEWRPLRAPSRTLRKRWEAVAQTLAAHEQGHLDYTLEAAQALRTELAEMSAMSSCEAIDNAIDRRFRRALMRLNSQNVLFDIRTNHGRRGAPTF